jgi:hypothetical protein
MLVWYEVGPWKRMVATRTCYEHNFPAPHFDSVESFIDYRVPVEKFTPLAEFDGSVIVERTAGSPARRHHRLRTDTTPAATAVQVAASCHDSRQRSCAMLPASLKVSPRNSRLTQSR